MCVGDSVSSLFIIDHHCTAAFTYYYDSVILRNKLSPLSIFRDLEKERFKMFMFYLYVFYRMYTNIQK